MTARRTRKAPHREPRTLCSGCLIDCTGSEYAVTAEGAQRLAIHADELVCWDCERRSRGVQS